MQTGFVGLGAMGTHMARNLQRAGLLTGVWNRTTDKATALAKELHCHAFASLAELAGNCEAVVICVSADADLRAVVAALDSGLSPNMIVMDCSTVGAGTAREIHAQLAALGVGFLDCPVSGGVEGARTASLAIMVGGKPEVFAKAEPILKCLGSSVTLTGPVGAGNTTKLANQIMVACNIAAMGEALTLATRCGLNPEVVVNAVKGGLAGSAVLNAKGPMLIARNFKPGFKINLHQKDLRNALQTAEANHVFLPLTAQVQQMLSSLIANGKGDLDHSAIATFIESASHFEVKVPAS